jgi:hypothetical protein
LLFVQRSKALQFLGSDTPAFTPIGRATQLAISVPFTGRRIGETAAAQRAVMMHLLAAPGAALLYLHC